MTPAGARRPTVVGILLVVALSGCHGGAANDTDGASSPFGSYTFATSVDGGVALNSLSGAQAMQLCADVNAANAANLQQLYCSAVNQAFAVDGARTYLEGNLGASSATLQAKCTSYLMGESGNPCFPAATCDAAAIATSSTYCMATVADVVACINDNTTITVDLLTTAPSCTMVSAATLNRFFVDGGAFEMYSVASSSASCLALAPCLGITTISGP